MTRGAWGVAGRKDPVDQPGGQHDHANALALAAAMAARPDVYRHFDECPDCVAWLAGVIWVAADG